MSEAQNTNHGDVEDRLELILNSVSQPSAKGIALSMVELMRSCKLLPGDRLPTVRDVALALNVSVPTVASAWADLRSQGVVETRRRGGTIVMPYRDRPVMLPSTSRPKAGRHDLAFGVADPSLQPPIAQALLAGLNVSALHRPEKDHALDVLVSAASDGLPFVPKMWSTASSASEATLLTLSAISRRGDRIAVEEPTSPRIMDILQTLGVEAIAVPCDDQGPTPEALVSALAMSPVAFIYQPRVQIPMGHTVTSERISALADILLPAPNVWIVEDDTIGPLSTAPYMSLGALIPDRITIIRTYCRAYGVDLRTAIFAGPEKIVQRAQSLRSFGAAMNSRILQGALAHLISDPSTENILAAARLRYKVRRETLADALRERGVETKNQDGLMLWVPVVNERSAILSLAASNINVGNGRVCYSTSPEQAHIRVATTLIPDDPRAVAAIADAIAESSRFKLPDDYD